MGQGIQQYGTSTNGNNASMMPIRRKRSNDGGFMQTTIVNWSTANSRSQNRPISGSLLKPTSGSIISGNTQMPLRMPPSRKKTNVKIIEFTQSGSRVNYFRPISTSIASTTSQMREYELDRGYEQGERQCGIKRPEQAREAELGQPQCPRTMDIKKTLEPSLPFGTFKQVVRSPLPGMSRSLQSLRNETKTDPPPSKHPIMLPLQTKKVSVSFADSEGAFSLPDAYRTPIPSILVEHQECDEDTSEAGCGPSLLLPPPNKMVTANDIKTTRDGNSDRRSPTLHRCISIGRQIWGPPLVEAMKFTPGEVE